MNVRYIHSIVTMNLIFDHCQVYFLFTDHFVDAKTVTMARCSCPLESLRCSLADVLVLPCQFPCLFLWGGRKVLIFLSLQLHLLPIQLRCMSSHLFCFHPFSTLRWNSVPVPTLRHIRGKAECILTNSLGGVITSQ